MVDAETRESFGKELIEAPIAPMSEEQKKHAEGMKATYCVDTAEEAWHKMIRENRKLVVTSFTSSGLNTDVLNTVIGAIHELAQVKEGSTFQSHRPKRYMEYFVEKEKADPAILDFIRKFSSADAVKKFDAAIENIKEKMSAPVTSESLPEIRDGLRAIYRLIYSQDPTF